MFLRNHKLYQLTKSHIFLSYIFVPPCNLFHLISPGIITRILRNFRLDNDMNHLDVHCQLCICFGGMYNMYLSGHAMRVNSSVQSLCLLIASLSHENADIPDIINSKLLAWRNPRTVSHEAECLCFNSHCTKLICWVTAFKYMIVHTIMLQVKIIFTRLKLFNLVGWLSISIVSLP